VCRHDFRHDGAGPADFSKFFARRHPSKNKNRWAKDKAASERGAGQTENHTQQHKNLPKIDGCKRARHANPRRTHFQHEMKEKRAFLNFSKITKKSADALAVALCTSPRCHH
jgi:hypothetical protein